MISESKKGSSIILADLKQGELLPRVEYLLGELGVEAIPVDARHTRPLQLQLVLSEEGVEVRDAVTPRHLQYYKCSLVTSSH